MEINYVLGIYPSLLENMVAKVYENDSGAEVDSIVIPETSPGAGHTVPVNVSFTGLDKRPHTLRLFTAGGTELQEFNIQPTENSVTVFDPIFFKIGDGDPLTPLEGTSVYSNPALAGLTNADLVISRAGSLRHPEQDYEVDILGGFGLAIPGDFFDEGEEIVIIRKPQVASNPVHDSVVGKQWGANETVTTMYLNVTSNMSYLPEHLRHLIRLSGTGQYHFTGTIPIGYPFRFTNQVAGTPVIYFDNAALIQPGGNVTQWSLPVGAIAEFVFDGTNWNLTMNSGAVAAAYKTVYQGEVLIGNVGAAPYGITSQDSRVNVFIPAQGTTNYKVRGAILGVSGDSNLDNDVSWSYKVINQFTFSVTLRKYVVQATNIKFDYSIELAT